MAKVGRKPKGPIHNKRAAFTTRVTPAIKKKLEDAAEETVRSVSQEVEIRIERSFFEDEILGTGPTRKLCQAIASAAAAIERETDKPWNETVVGYEAMSGILRSAAPAFATGEAKEYRNAKLELQHITQELEEKRKEEGPFGLLGKPYEDRSKELREIESTWTKLSNATISYMEQVYEGHVLFVNALDDFFATVRADK